MAIFKKAVEKIGGFLEKFDEFIVAGLLLPVGKKIFDHIAEKGAEKAEKKLGKLFGFDEAAKSSEDELLFGMVVEKLTVPQQNEVNAFEARLRREDSKKAEAFVLFVSNKVKMLEREVKETVTPPKKKKGEKEKEENDSPASKTEQTYKKRDEGINSAKKFLLMMLRVSVAADEDATFNARVAFLEGKNALNVPKPAKGTEFLKQVGSAIGADTLEGKEELKRSLDDLANWLDSK